jgi:hypothetical protein
LEQLKVMNRASQAHAYYSGIPRSISAENLAKVVPYQVEPAQVTVFMNVYGQCRGSVVVSERISKEDLRKTIATALGGHCRIRPKELPVKDGTEVVVIPSYVE